MDFYSVSKNFIDIYSIGLFFINASVARCLYHALEDFFYSDVKMKILKMSLLTLGMGLSGFAQADFVGVKGEVGYWFYDGKANMSSQFPDDQISIKKVVLNSHCQ